MDLEEAAALMVQHRIRRVPVLDRGDLAASEKAFTKAVALRDDGTAWFNLGAVRARLNDLAGAQAAFKRAAEHHEVRQQANQELDKLREATK